MPEYQRTKAKSIMIGEPEKYIPSQMHLAKNYISYANAYFIATELLYNRYIDHMNGYNPLIFLMAHTVELGLKGFAAANGVEEGILRSDRYGHKINNLMDLAEDFKIDVKRETREILRFLSEPHAKFWSRYDPHLRSNAWLIPDISELKELVDAVEVFIQKADEAAT